MNCAALPETLIEAELFGHEAGAFTGATRARAGRFEEADKGTLFLDELATLSMGAQERLLRAVEYGEVTRIGSNRVRSGSTCGSSRRPTRTCRGWPTRALPRRPARPAELRGHHPAAAARARGRRAGAGRLSSAGAWRAELGWDSWPGFADHVARARGPRLAGQRARTAQRGRTRGLSLGRHGTTRSRTSMFDPFESPWKPRRSPVAHGRSGERCVAPLPQQSAAADYDSIDDLRAAVDAHERAIVEHASAAIAGTSARPPRRSA